MEQNKNKSGLTVTVNNASPKSKADLEYDELTKQMTADLNSKFGEVAIAEALNTPVVKGILSQAKSFFPMGVKQINNFFGRDKVRVMIYIDEISGALVFQKMNTSNIAQLEWHQEPDVEKDFFILKKEELDNPEAFIKSLTSKLNINLF